jgi:putative NADPH-quinone reductase
MAHICIIQGHPDATERHFCHALAEAYSNGAVEAGHKVSQIDLATLDIPILTNPRAFKEEPPTAILETQQTLVKADHLLVIYPLWLGTMPALVKAFFEQVSCGNFLIEQVSKGWPKQKMKGKSAHVVVTMGMPALAYKLMFGAHGVRGFESGILGMAGIGPIRETLLGGVDGSLEKREGWLKRLRDDGRRCR